MRTNIERRLAELRSELATGQRMVGELEAQEAHLRRSLLRIAGAVQVLEELLASGADEEPPAAPIMETANAARDAIAVAPEHAARNGAGPPAPQA